MDAFAPGYLIYRFFFRIFIFLRHWYVGSFRVVAHRTMNALESLDRTFALRITLQNLFQPLYQDHSVVGHLLGFLFRLVRLAVGAAAYAFLIALAVVVYLSFAFLPFYLVYRSFSYP